jgi:hypothetical protein
VKPLIACAIMLCIALPLHAQTYKWVDENGVTNYSSDPPPGKKGSNAKVVEDRISIVEKDPAFDKAAEGLRQREAKRAEYAEAEYARRQAMPATQPATNDIYSECPYGSDCSGYGYYPGYGYYGGHGPGWRRAAFFHGKPRPTPHGAIPSKPARTIPTPLRVSAPLR